MRSLRRFPLREAAIRSPLAGVSSTLTTAATIKSSAVPSSWVSSPITPVRRPPVFAKALPTSTTSKTLSTNQQSLGNQHYTVDDQLFGIFAQDDYRASPRLTINLGLRYERQT